MKIYNSEWLSLSKEIKVKLIRLAILESSLRHPLHAGRQGKIQKWA